MPAWKLYARDFDGTGQKLHRGYQVEDLGHIHLSTVGVPCPSCSQGYLGVPGKLPRVRSARQCNRCGAQFSAEEERGEVLLLELIHTL